MLVFSKTQLGKGWTEVPADTPVKTCDQFYNYVESKWMTGSFFTHEKEINKGKVPYRRPISFLSYVIVFPGLIRKVYRRKIKTSFVKFWKYITLNEKNLDQR